MRTHTPAHLEHVRDPVGRTFWPAYKGRDGERTPMQWDGTPGSGFTRATPWLPIPATAGERNVARQIDDRRSVLSFYRRLIHQRRGSRALLEGRLRVVGSDPYVFAYVRESASETMLIVLNMSGETREAGLEPAVAGAGGCRVEVGTHRAAGQALEPAALVLAPFEAIICHADATAGSAAG